MKCTKNVISHGEYLRHEALKAAAGAHCPYSKFHVGAAVRMSCSSDKDHFAVFQGCNVENASYGLTICAERVAIFGAVQYLQSHFPNSGKPVLEDIALAFPDAPKESPARFKMPCGACRQVMAEFSTPKTRIWLPPFPKPVGINDIFPFPFEL